MKIKTKLSGSLEDNWSTPTYILTYIKETFFNGNEYFDPCPLSKKVGDKYIIEEDGLSIDWQKYNFVNPPYNRTDKPKFVKKAYEEYKKGNVSVLLIPNTTETNWFHELLVPYAQIFFIKNRVQFKGTNTKGEYVTNKTGQSGSMLCVLDPNKSPLMKPLTIALKPI